MKKQTTSLLKYRGQRDFAGGTTSYAADADGNWLVWTTRGRNGGAAKPVYSL